MHPLEDNVLINCILLCYHIMKQIVSMLPRVCTVIDHRRHPTVVSQKSGAQSAATFLHFL